MSLPITPVLGMTAAFGQDVDKKEQPVSKAVYSSSLSPLVVSILSQNFKDFYFSCLLHINDSSSQKQNVSKHDSLEKLCSNTLEQSLQSVSSLENTSLNKTLSDNKVVSLSFTNDVNIKRKTFETREVQYILKEILATEKQYTFLLAILYHGYINSLNKITKNEYYIVDTLSCCVKCLYDSHCYILSEFESILVNLENFDDEEMLCAAVDISQLISEKGVSISSYKNYLENYTLFLLLLENLNEKLQQKRQYSSKAFFVIIESIEHYLELKYNDKNTDLSSTIMRFIQEFKRHNVHNDIVTLCKKNIERNILDIPSQVISEETVLRLDLSLKSVLQAPVARIFKYKLFLQHLVLVTSVTPDFVSESLGLEGNSTETLSISQSLDKLLQKINHIDESYLNSTKTDKTNFHTKYSHLGIRTKLKNVLYYFKRVS